MTPCLPGYVPPDPEEGMRPIKGGFPIDEDYEHNGLNPADTQLGRGWFFHELRYHGLAAQLDLDIDE